jgi:hypothetical protein
MQCVPMAVQTGMEPTRAHEDEWVWRLCIALVLDMIDETAAKPPPQQHLLARGDVSASLLQPLSRIVGHLKPSFTRKLVILFRRSLAVNLRCGSAQLRLISSLAKDFLLHCANIGNSPRPPPSSLQYDDNAVTQARHQRSCATKPRACVPTQNSATASSCPCPMLAQPQTNEPPSLCSHFKFRRALLF